GLRALSEIERNARDVRSASRRVLTGSLRTPTDALHVEAAAVARVLAVAAGEEAGVDAPLAAGAHLLAGVVAGGRVGGEERERQHQCDEDSDLAIPGIHRVDLLRSGTAPRPRVLLSISFSAQERDFAPSDHLPSSQGAAAIILPSMTSQSVPDERETDAALPWVPGVVLASSYGLGGALVTGAW